MTDIHTGDYLKTLSDIDLQDLISWQESIVDNCISWAQTKAKETDGGSADCNGLYFSFALYKAAVRELENRYIKINRTKQNDNKKNK